LIFLGLLLGCSEQPDVSLERGVSLLILGDISSDMLSPNMNPRLIIISGELKGTTFALTEDETSVGRDASNSISLNELSISRRHCLINREPQLTNENHVQKADDEKAVQILAEKEVTATDSHFSIVDLESYNGTFVGGIPVKAQRLADGDQILIGDVLVVFLL